MSLIKMSPSSIIHHQSSIISQLIDCLTLKQGWISQISLISNYDHGYNNNNRRALLQRPPLRGWPNKCFNSLWAQDNSNDIYEAGCDDDKLLLLHLGNKNENIAIKTSHEITKITNIENVIMQGEYLGVYSAPNHQIG